MIVPERNTEFAALVGKPTAGWQNARKLSHLIARDLRGMILRGELARGQSLPSESDLLQAFAVSRDTLREALRILESEGLIQIRRGRGGGAVVQRPHPRAVTRHVSLLLQVRGATIGDIHEVRRIVEPPAAERLVGISPQEVGTLVELHELELSQLHEPPACVTALLAFDQAVFRLSGNTAIALVSGIFRELVAGQALVEGALSPRSTVLVTLTDCHRAVLDALVASDPGAVRTAWTTYLAEGVRLLGRNRLDEPFDVVPLWRAHGSTDGGGSDKMAASIAKDIRLRIAEGDLEEGDQLPPMPELAAQFGVSRPTMRECLRILEVEGLVDLRTGSRSGARILEPSTDTAGQLASVVLAAAQSRMIDVIEARQLVEPSVVELMAARADQQTLTLLAERVTKLKEMVDDTPAFIDYIEDFERHAFAATNNPAISVALEMLHWVTIRSRREVLVRATSVPQVVRSNRRACRIIEACVEAAQRGDAEGAGRAWAEHLEAIRPFFRNAYGDRLIVDLFD